MVLPDARRAGMLCGGTAAVRLAFDRQLCRTSPSAAVAIPVDAKSECESMKFSAVLAATVALCLTSACADTRQSSATVGQKPLTGAELTQLHSAPLTMRGQTRDGNTFTIRRYRDGSQHMEWGNASISGSDSGMYEVRGEELCSKWNRGGGSECARVVQTSPGSYQTMSGSSVTSTYTVAR